MGGRGASSGLTAREKPEVRSRFQREAPPTAAQQKQSRTTAQSGTALQSNYIEYVKKQTGVDLSKARDTQFDTKQYFNIDTRDISRNDLATVKRLAQQYPGNYDVSFEDNGANRIAIRVKRRKK